VTETRLSPEMLSAEIFDINCVSMGIISNCRSHKLVHIHFTPATNVPSGRIWNSQNYPVSHRPRSLREMLFTVALIYQTPWQPVTS